MPSAPVLIAGDSFLYQDGSQIGRTESRKAGQKKTKQHDIADDDDDTDQNLDTIGHHLIVEEETRDKSEKSDQNGDAFDLVQIIKFLAIGTAHGLKVKGNGQDENGEDALEIGTQWIGKDNDECENGLPQHDDRIPKNEPLSVGPVQKPGDLVDPSGLVVVFRVARHNVSDRRRIAKSEQGKTWPSGQGGEQRMRSFVAFDAGIDGPVMRRCIVANVQSVVDIHTGQGTDDGPREGDVADVEHGNDAEQNLLEQIRSVLTLLDGHDPPGDGKDENGCQRNHEIDETADDRCIDGGICWNQTRNGTANRLGCHTADEL